VYLKEYHGKFNSSFNRHLKNMDTVDEICANLKISRSMLMNLLNFWGQHTLKIFYVSSEGADLKGLREERNQ
jgi:hypothetical protein